MFFTGSNLVDLKISSYSFSWPNILSAIILAAMFELVIPHLLNPVATYALSHSLENLPIYGILSSVMQSSVFQRYFIFPSGHIFFATSSKYLYELLRSICAPVLWSNPATISKYSFPYFAILNDIVGSSVFIYIPSKSFCDVCIATA